MFSQNAASSSVVLGSDDLALLQRFLEAWCDENGVDMNNEKAADVASALFDWYQSDVGDRILLKSAPPEPLQESAELRILLQKLKET